MSYVQPPAKARRDKMRSDLYNTIVANQRATQSLICRGHKPNGEHNELEVCRAVGTVVLTAGSPAYEGETSNVGAITDHGVGITGIRVSNIKRPYTVRVMPTGNSAESVPLIANIEQVDDDDFKVYLWKLAALSGNSWALADEHFAFAVHAHPSLETGLDGYSDASFSEDAWGLNAGGTFLNTAIRNQAVQYANVGTEHVLATGAHSTRLVASAWEHIAWNDGSSSYGAYGGIGVASVTRLATGQVKVTLDSPWTTPFQVFATVGYNTGTGTAADQFIINFPRSQMSSGGGTPYVTAYIYQYDPDANTWAAADADFDLWVHK